MPRAHLDHLTPVLAAVALVPHMGSPPGGGGAGPRRRRAGRRGARRGPPRRGRRAPRRRALRLARPGGRGHHHRGRPDRHADGHHRQGHLGPGPRHRLRRRDDHRQRHRRPLAAGRRAEAPPGRVQPRGHRRRAGDRHRAGRALPGGPLGDDLGARAGVHRRPARLRRDRLAGPLRHVRLHPDHPAPRLLPARDDGGRPRLLGRRRSSTSRSTSTPTGTPTRPTDRATLSSLGLLVVSLVAVVGLAKIESPAIESGVAARRLPPGRRRRRDRAARARAGAHRGRPRGRPQPRPGQPQPRDGLGHGLDRPHHPGHRDRQHLARRTRSSSGSTSSRSCC